LRPQPNSLGEIRSPPPLSDLLLNVQPVKNIIGKFRRLVREEKYTISTHANEEMSDDELMAVDVEQAILTGHVVNRLSNDPRGTRYEIAGNAADGRRVGVVCRIMATGWLIIITVYVIGE